MDYSDEELLDYREEDIPEYKEGYVYDEEHVDEEEDAKHTNNYHNYVASVDSTGNSQKGIEMYKGIDANEALDIFNSHTNKEGRHPSDYICSFTRSQLSNIRNDMMRMEREGYTTSTYASFAKSKEFTPKQLSLLKNLNRLLYQYECPFAVNNSETGTGKSLMGLAQAIMSGCRYVVIVGPSSSESVWRDAVRVLPEIKEALESQFNTQYHWPDEIWYSSYHQLYKDKGRFKPMLIGGRTITAVNSYSVISDRYKNLKGDLIKLEDFIPTGDGYPYAPGQRVTLKRDLKAIEKGEVLHAPPDEFYYEDDQGRQVDEDGFLINDDGKYVDESGKRVKKKVKGGKIVFCERIRAQPEGSARRLIEDGLFYIHDEFHGSKNDTITSRATGTIPAEIVASRGGIKDIQLIHDHAPVFSGRSPTYVPFRGQPFEYGAKTGRSRVLLMSATVSDRIAIFSIGRSMGLYRGNGTTREYLTRGESGERVTDYQSLIDVSDNLGFYLALIEENLSNLDDRYMELYNKGVLEEEPSQVPRPKVMKYFEFFNKIYHSDGRGKKSHMDGTHPKVDTIIRTILGDSFFVQAIGYDGPYKQEMNDLIVSLKSQRAEMRMTKLVENASKFFVGKDHKNRDKLTGSAINALVEIESQLVPHAIKQIIEILKESPTNRVVIGLAYNKGVAEVFNTMKNHVNELGIKAPLLLTGRTPQASRPYVNALFQHDIGYRLLIANVGVIKQSISLHPVYPGWFTTIIVPIPQNAVDYYQIAGRVLRMGAMADSRFLVISPGLRHSYRFYQLESALSLIGHIEKANSLRGSVINDRIVDLIIEIHEQLKEENPDWPLDLIHQLHPMKDNTIVDAPFKQAMYEWFSRHAFNNDVSKSKANLIKRGVDDITRRYKDTNRDYPVSLVNLIRKRNDKADNLQSVTSQERVLPKSEGYLEKAILSAYATTEDLQAMEEEEIEFEDEEGYDRELRYDSSDEEADQEIEISGEESVDEVEEVEDDQ
jgi:hypothetical protein